jgi:signal transduction histidine kinase
MPVAIVALDVAGQIRERSPADMAIFGTDASRLIDRFVQPAAGQALLARAASDGNAEATAWLTTVAGQQQFRISLWRQRGGERIRIVAAFSPVEACATSKGNEAAGAMPDAVRAALIQMGNNMRSPLAAVLGFAELIRASPNGLGPDDAADHAADIIAAAWRLMRIADDLEAVGTSREVQPSMNLAEVDIARLVRRIARLSVPVARAVGVAVDIAGVPEPGAGPLILGDESTLWAGVDNLLQNAIHHSGRGAAVMIAVRPNGGDLVLEVADDGPGLEADDLARRLQGEIPGCGLSFVSATARANGAKLEIDSAPGRGMRARIVFPAARCLNPV